MLEGVLSRAYLGSRHILLSLSGLDIAEERGASTDGFTHEASDMRFSNGRRPLLHGGFVNLWLFLFFELNALSYSLFVQLLDIHLNHCQVLVVGRRCDLVPIPAVLVRRRCETIPDGFCRVSIVVRCFLRRKCIVRHLTEGRINPLTADRVRRGLNHVVRFNVQILTHFDNSLNLLDQILVGPPRLLEN